MICLTGRNDISASFLDRMPRPREAAQDHSGLHELNIQSDSYLVANKNAAGFECSVPGQAEVFSVDLGRGRDRYPGIAPGILHWRCWPFNCKRYLAGEAAHG